MHCGIRFFSGIECADEKGHSQIIRMAADITRYCNTDFVSVMNLSYEMIQQLYDALCDLLDAENERIEKAKVKNNGKG